MEELSIIQKTYDLIVWFVPILNRLPRDHKFMLGDRIISELYDLLEVLNDAQYAKIKVAKLQALNPKLSLLRRQIRLLLDFGLIKTKRYEYAAKQLNGIGMELGAWIKQRKKADVPPGRNLLDASKPTDKSVSYWRGVPPGRTLPKTVPAGRTPIARRFNGGITDQPNQHRPGGTYANTPPFHR